MIAPDARLESLNIACSRIAPVRPCGIARTDAERRCLMVLDNKPPAHGSPVVVSCSKCGCLAEFPEGFDGFSLIPAATRLANRADPMPFFPDPVDPNCTCGCHSEFREMRPDVIHVSFP